ncbi:hypothetical protein GMOD_00008503 [Pyrenophora seminiperda CCB06]|uniref:Uncharacterized protein n=1 Tax=Pyrenophora seminiperda CCB06 TaxID=1302712 RepID=A0A3M7M8P0_9PLEO|nr:hypothetical protein GMOD_00008503 [Pyrenophora seminiperda CCB06]
MGYLGFGELGTIRNYAKTLYEERAETTRKRRLSSASDPTMTKSTTRKPQTYSKLHKPPTIQSLHERPRNRLQKRRPTSLMHVAPPTAYLFVLEYDPYPQNTQPSTFLGVYSSINTVTADAFRHGAHSFSREGLLDGSEYLSPTGRIKIFSHAVQSVGVSAVLPEDRSSPKQADRPIRLDVPHPQSQRFDSQQDISRPNASDATVFLALHEGPTRAFCIGLFTTKALAWGACLKDKAWLEVSDSLVEEDRGVCSENMPQISARLVGSGRHRWFVKAFNIDGVIR